MPAERRIWSQEELLVVFRLYCRTHFGRLHQLNPEIIELAGLIGRTPGAVAMKACNFASLDPDQQSRGIRALGNVSRADRELWGAFSDDSEFMAQKAEAAYAALVGQETEEYVPGLWATGRRSGRKQPSKPGVRVDELSVPLGATEKESLVRTRRVQSFFRAAVLISYDNRCAITGLAVPELLNASHIIPWSVDEKRRADPRNGICLNPLHDRAFDRGLISFDENLRVIVSSNIAKCEECEIHRQQLVEICGRPLRMPERFQPERAAVEFHRKHIYRP